MSLILDALNKNERERQAPREVPDLAAGPHYTPPPPTPHIKWLVTGIVVLAVLVLALLIALLLRQGNPTPAAAPPLATHPAAVTAQAVPVAEPVRREPVQEWRPLPRPTTQPPAPPAEVQSTASATPAPQDIAALYAAEETIAAAADPAPAQVNAASAARPIEREQVAALWRDMQTQPLPERQTTRPAPSPPATKPAATKPAAAAVSKGRDPKGLAQFGEVPYLHELPAQQQAKIPTLMYNKHEAADGAVILNKKRFHLGQSPAPGVTIEQIVSDGVVLSFEGRQFKLDALSSWVNR